jgi:hypothetical protein
VKVRVAAAIVGQALVIEAGRVQNIVGRQRIVGRAYTGIIDANIAIIAGTAIAGTLISGRLIATAIGQLAGAETIRRHVIVMLLWIGHARTRAIVLAHIIGKATIAGARVDLSAAASIIEGL